MSIDVPRDMMEVGTGLQRLPSGDRLVVEAPDAVRTALHGPIYKDPNHALLRPYERLLTRGDPNVGFVQYSFGTLHGRDPRILAAFSMRRKRSSARGDLTPMDLTIYPGVSLSKPHSRGNGGVGRVHHYSIREAERGIQVYAHVQTADGVDRPGQAKRVVPQPELGGLITLGQIFAKDWHAFDPCGIATARVPPEIVNARLRAGTLSNYPAARTHPVTPIDGPKELRAVPHYLWQAYFLGRRDLSIDDMAEIVHFFGRGVNPQLRVMGPAVEYDGDIRGRLTTLPLDFEHETEAPYRFLHTLTTVLPGRISSGTSLVALGDFLPFLSTDLPGREEAFARYAKERYALSA